MVVLSVEDQAAITSSWAELKKDLTKNGLELFVTLFQWDPSTHKFFKWSKGKNIADAKADPAMAAHAQKVMAKIDAYVNTMGDPKAMAEEVKKLTKTHTPRGVRIAEFEKLRACYGQFLKATLDGKSTPEVEAAWDRMLQIHNTMIKQYE